MFNKNMFGIAMQQMMEIEPTLMRSVFNAYEEALNAGFDDCHAMAVALEKYKIFHGVYRQKEEDEEDG